MYVLPGLTPGALQPIGGQEDHLNKLVPETIRSASMPGGARQQCTNACLLQHALFPQVNLTLLPLQHYFIKPVRLLRTLCPGCF